MTRNEDRNTPVGSQSPDGRVRCCWQGHSVIGKCFAFALQVVGGSVLTSIQSLDDAAWTHHLAFPFVEYAAHYEVFRLTLGYANVKSSLPDFRCSRGPDLVAKRPSSSLIRPISAAMTYLANPVNRALGIESCAS